MNTRRRLVYGVTLAALLLGACGTIRIEPQEIDAADAAGEDTPLPTEGAADAPATDAPTPEADVIAGGIRLSYPNSAIGMAAVQVVPATLDGPEWGIQPQHALVTFDAYPLTGTLLRPEIRVYRVDELVAMSDTYRQIVGRLEALLDEQPAGQLRSEGITPLPIPNAAQTLLTQLEYVDFQNGRGVRIFTHFAQAYIPVTNHDAFYTFQGLTDDGQYYISAIMPAGQASLPPTTPDLNGWLEEPVGENYAAYVAQTAQMLDAADPASFTPALTELDALIASLKVEGLPEAAPATPATVATHTYENSDYGFAFDYPGEWTIGEGPNMAAVSGDGLQVTVMYRLAGEAWPGGSGGLPAGDLIDADATVLLGVPTRVQHLVRDGLPRVALYTVADPEAQTPDSLDIFVRADATGGVDAALSDEQLAIVSDIVRSFRRTG